ncbi:MAG: hypothetical protein EBV68_05500 [Betaproteobacteria bacterium]|nr:hypothetical protein [Betaproteobacteria bacterium]
MVGSYTRTVGSLLGANYSASDTPGSGAKPAAPAKAAGAPAAPAAPVAPEAKPAAGKVASNV